MPYSVGGRSVLTGVLVSPLGILPDSASAPPNIAKHSRTKHRGSRCYLQDKPTSPGFFLSELRPTKC